MNISREDRLELIEKLRPNLQDALIGELFGITRERVAQIAGRRRVNSLERGRTGMANKDAILECAAKGFSVRETRVFMGKQGVDVPDSTISYIFRLFDYGRGGQKRMAIRRKRRIEEVSEKLRKFIATGRKFNLYEISKWDYNLHAKMQRFLPNPNSKEPCGKQWAKVLGVEWEGYEIVNGKKKYP